MPIDLSRLDPDQRAAVSAPDGAVLVFAGAGSGKTRTLTARVAYLIEQGVEPSEIMAMTFTKKAAEEMKNRLRRLVAGPGATGRDGLSGLRVGTFHAQMSALMRSLPPEVLKRVGRTPKFSIWDEDDRAAAVWLACKAADVFIPEGVTKGDVASRISAWKNEDLTLSAFGGAPGSRNFASAIVPATNAEKIAARIWETYEDSLRQSDACDFDDLLTLPVYLLGTDPALCQRVSANIRHLLVDEFQDTNVVQMHLIELLSGAHKNLFVVGDDAQSIYRFRGARIENILTFEQRYPASTKVVLNTNYRSTQPILDLANTVIAGSTQNVRKHLKAHTSAPEAKKPVLRRFDDENAEAAWIIEEIKSLSEHGVSLADLAILVRVRAQTRALEGAARVAGIPYRVVGGFAFWERKEVKDLMSWLRLILNPADEMAFKRAVEHPKRGVGDVLQEAITGNAHASGGHVLNSARLVSESTLGTTKARAGLKEMCELVTYWSGEIDSRYPGDVIRDVIERSGLRASYGASADSAEGLSAIENLFEVVNAASNYETGQLREFVEANTLEAVPADASDADQLVIATLHGAKGLEWRGVWLAGFEEGLLPSGRALQEEGGEDEERRLAYVGITRAKKMLTLTITASRFLNGERFSPRASRFLDHASSRYALADHTTPDGGMAARMAKAGVRPYGSRPTAGFGSGSRPTSGFGSRSNPSAPRFPRHP